MVVHGELGNEVSAAPNCTHIFGSIKMLNQLMKRAHDLHVPILCVIR